MRRAFTLIEILIAVILLGIGVTSAIALIALGIRRSEEVAAFTTMAPVATAAATIMAGQGQTTGQDIETVDPAFRSPYAVRVEVPSSTVLGAGRLVRYEVRIYGTPEDRAGDVRRLGTMTIQQYLRN